MKTQNFNTVNDLSNAKSENKTAQYISMSRSFAKEATILAEKNDSFMLKMSAQEVINSMRKAEGADCEYTAYANAHAAEKWFEKMVQ